MIQKCLLLVSICCLTIGSTSFAQTEKGSLMVGGGFSLMYVNDVLDVTLQPEAGIFVADNFAVGAGVLLRELIVFGGANQTGFTAGPFFRYYFGDGKFRPFLNTSVTGGLSVVSNSDEKYKVVNWSAGPGVSIFLTKSVSLDLMLRYLGEWYKYTSPFWGDYTPDVNHALLFSVGFQVFFQ